MKNNKVVYIHRKKTDDTIFYVGIGKPSRPYRNKGRSSLWNRTVNKHGYYIEIIFEDLSQEEACEIEIYLIEKLGRRDLKKGYLVNLTDGGEGVVNASEESKKKMSEANKGNTYNKGRKMSEKTKEKISEANKGNTYNKGRKHSDEAKRKMSNNSHKSKKVINTVTGDVYNSARKASEAINVNRVTLQGWLNGRYPNKSNLKYLK
jgi:hypothetical protein